MEETEELALAADSLEPRSDVRLLQSVRLNNVLSFGPATPPLELRALNVLIGPNGSGKSNLLDALTLFRFTPSRLEEAVRQHGSSVSDWIWKGDPTGTAVVEVKLTNPDPQLQPIRHLLKFRETSFRFELTGEWIDSGRVAPGSQFALPYFIRGNKQGNLYQEQGETHHMDYSVEDPDQSILALRRDPVRYPQLNYLAHLYEKFRFYRDWAFGRSAANRQAQKPDVRNDYLAENGTNLGLVLNRLRRNAEVKARILAGLNDLYEGITDFDVAFEGGTVQVFLQEGEFSIPASRLSDGTLRYLNLLVILLDPTPPPLICLEEPELALHPHAVVAIGKLIKEAAERTQLLVTTHSDILLDVLGSNPEDVIVCEKHEGQTELTRLSEPELRGWLQRYSLSQLWTRGKLGGNRW